MFTVILFSCSNAKEDYKKVTGLSATQVEGVWVYTISIDGGDPVTTNKATVDFYKHSGAPECYEGIK